MEHPRDVPARCRPSRATRERIGPGEDALWQVERWRHGLHVVARRYATYKARGRRRSSPLALRTRRCACFRSGSDSDLRKSRTKRCRRASSSVVSLTAGIVSPRVPTQQSTLLWSLPTSRPSLADNHPTGFRWERERQARSLPRKVWHLPCRLSLLRRQTAQSCPLRRLYE